MGDVTIQRSRLTGRIVCVKRSRWSCIRGGEFLEDPVEEARLLKIMHEAGVRGVVEFVDSCRADPTYFWLVMEACEADFFSCIVE